MADYRNTWVVIPTYNERENIKELIESLISISQDLNILFIDDSSPDGTAQEIRNISNVYPNIHLIVREKKMGIGSAYVDGFKYCLERNCEYVATIDADGQHPPEKLPEFFAAVDKADLVIGSRYIKGGSIVGWGLSRKLISKFANIFASNILSLDVKDCTSGFRVYNKRAVQLVVESKLNTPGFEFQVVALKVLQGKVRVKELPYTFRYRKRGKSKLALSNILVFFLRVIWEAL